MLTDQAARDAVLPPELRGRPLEDGLVVERAGALGIRRRPPAILSGLFLVAAVVMLHRGRADAADAQTPCSADPEAASSAPMAGDAERSGDDAARGSAAAF